MYLARANMPLYLELIPFSLLSLRSHFFLMKRNEKSRAASFLLQIFQLRYLYFHKILVFVLYK